MRAHTITTTIKRPKPRTPRRVLALVLAVSSLAVPATASAFTDSPNYPSDDSGYSSVSAIVGDPSSPAAGAADSGYSSLNSITGAPASEPTLVSGGSGDSVDGFDWGSAAIGAGAVLALGALGAAALLTVRRRTPSVSTS